MLGPVALDEERAALRVQAEREEGRGHLAGLAAQALRVVQAREGVVVDDAVDRLVLPLEPDVVPDRAKVVADVRRAGRLDPGEDPWSRGRRGDGGGGRRDLGRHRGPSVADAPCPPITSPSATIPGDARPPSRPASVSRPPLRVGMLGAGTVGHAVIEGLTAPPRTHSPARTAPRSSSGGIAVRDLGPGTRRRAPRPALLTDAPAHLVADPETDVIVEVMGGDEPARTLIAAALGAGKAVVTANKHVIAHHGPELEAAARRTGAAFRFEAAVAGGIPVLSPLATDLAGNDIRRVRGIINGTTNYILTAMAQEGRPYEDVLVDAQELGYAEADPSGDVEGDDAVNKLVVLARLAFGRWLDPATIGRRPPTARGDGAPGITGVTDQELEGAAALGLTIKLLATATLPRRRDRGCGRPDRDPVAQSVRLDGRGAQPSRDRRRAARDGRAVRAGCRWAGHEQRDPGRPRGDRPRCGFHVGGSGARHGSRGGRRRPARRTAALVRVPPRGARGRDPADSAR